MVAGVSAAVDPMARTYYETEPQQLKGVIGGVPGAASYESLRSGGAGLEPEMAARLDSLLAGQVLVILVILGGTIVGRNLVRPKGVGAAWYGEGAVTDSLGFFVAAILTLCVFSYLLGDNALYRLAEHLFVAVAVGYVFIVALHQVLWAKLLSPMLGALDDGNMGRVLLLLVPLLLGLLLLFKSSRRAGPLSWFGNLSVAFLLGVGAAVAIAGGLLGTLLPQVGGASDVTRYVTRYGTVLGLLSGIVAVVGTVGVLLHFDLWLWRGAFGAVPQLCGADLGWCGAVVCADHLWRASCDDFLVTPTVVDGADSISH